MNKIDKALERQIDRNKTKNILNAVLDQTIETDPNFLAALEDLLAGDPEIRSDVALESAISSAAKLLLQRLYAINQYLQIDAAKTCALERIYRRTWRRIVATHDIQAALRNYHYPALQRWVARAYPRHFVKALRSVPAIGHVVCAEYSPSLQIALLHLDPPSLQPPLLDIGCGSSAALLRHLRALHMEAYGIDRLVEKPAPHLQQVDWFDYHFEPETWGTITSNMAFTNHLLYAYHHESARLNQYVITFNKIVESLIIGGSFHYAPSVPFLEQTLDPGRYRVETFPITRDISMTRTRRMLR